jgi:hypothetical protein
MKSYFCELYFEIDESSKNSRPIARPAGWSAALTNGWNQIAIPHIDFHFTIGTIIQKIF